MKKPLAAATLLGALVCCVANAQSLDTLLDHVDFSFGGFGTLGAVRTSTGQAQFVRGFEDHGATKSFSESVDSNLGLQASVRFNSWVSVTAQFLEDASSLTQPLSWAYLKVEPVENLSVKLGRVQMPLFAVSDSRDVNYANVWLRPPNEVYSLANIEELNGGEASYNLPIGRTQLVLTGYAGQNDIVTMQGYRLVARDIRGTEVRWQTEWVTLRGSYTSTNSGANGDEKYVFEGVGALVDHSHIVAQAEFAKRYAPETELHQFIDSVGWYVLGGYRIGKVFPYVSYAATTKSKPYAPIFAYVQSYDQSTKTIGVRWDAFKSAALKFQFDRVDPKGTAGISFVEPGLVRPGPGFGTHGVNVISLAVDFVF